MRFIAALLGIAALAGAFGCGSADRQIDQLRTDQEQATQALQQQIEELSAQIRRLQADVQMIDGELFDLSAGFETILIADRHTRRAETATVGLETATDPTRSASGTESAADALEPIPADLEVLATELTKMREQVETLADRYDEDRRIEALRDPRQTWEALGDEEQLHLRLDAFATTHADTIEDPTTRQEFLDDVAALKEQVHATAQMSVDEQVEYFATRLTEQINTATNQRQVQWWERQLEMLQSDNEQEVAAFLDAATRIERAASIGELGEKYSIAPDTLRDNGLQAFGGRAPGGGRGGRRGR